MRISQFFEEENGRLSSMRLYGFILIVTGCFLMVYSMVKGQTPIIDPSVIAASFMLIGSGLTGKAVQKKDELGGKE
jgi:hypothetical protein